MPWFRIDDKAHSHPKLIKAGNAALGLWLRCGAYAAQHLTDGIVPGVLAELYGTKPQAAKLVKAGLWHEHGHDCRSGCPDPAPGDYVFHDFLDDGRNTSRARHEAERKKARDRQAKHREGGRDGGNGDQKPDEKNNFTFDSSSKKSESASEKSQSSDEHAGQEQVSRRDASVTGIHAAATPYPSTSYGSTGAAAREPEAEPPIRSYDSLGDLKRAIAAAGIAGVSWNLQASQIERIRQVQGHVGVGPMVAMAASNASYRGTPGSAGAWIADWETLEPEAPTQQDAGGNVIRLAPGPQRPAVSDQRTQQAIETGRRLQALADAKNQENR
ncbi:hypothetical protein [Streptomyces sp. NPDC060188]|uniref:hypothetical protein n=1 Tax=Streptomyces sp. NPDC060188 TaxID=3347068 RepID=UPI003662D880